MPQFDLRGIRLGKYVNTSGTISYTDFASFGGAMGANLELTFAEGRLYAEGVLAEYLRLATGGTISIATKYIPSAAQKLLFGSSDKSRTVGSSTVTGLQETAKDSPNYVGVAFYAPDMVDGTEKFTCVFVSKALFGAPSMAFRTKEGNTITFATPTSTGEFMPDDSSAMAIREVAIVDSAADAVAWCKAVLGET